jgi:hypothetical protein
VIAAILVVGALLLVPGVGAALAVAPPGAIAIETRIALAFGLGYALVAGSAILLALAHAFARPSFVAAVVVATAVAWFLAVKRASLRTHWAALVKQAREAPFPLVGGLGLVLAVALLWPFQPEGRVLSIRPAWRYWADGLELGSAGHVPAQSGQWGYEIPTTVSKVVLNAFEAGVSTLLGPHPLAPMHAILVVATVGFVAALLALGRELGLGNFAPLLPALTVLVPKSLPLSHEIPNHHGWYSAEGLGRMVAFSALLLGIYAVRTRSRGPVLLTGVLLAIAGLTHGVPTLIAAVLLALYAAGVVLLDWGLLRPVLVGGAVLVALTGVLYVGVLGLSGGDLGFQGATGGSAFSRFPANVDPTRSFTNGKILPRKNKEGHFLIPPREIGRRLVKQVFSRPRSARAGLVIFLLLGAASLVLALRARQFLPVVLMSWGLIAAIVVIALFFSYSSETRVPGDFGVRRLYPYAAFLPALLVPALLEAISRPFFRRNKTVAAVVALVVAALAVAAAVERIPHRPLPHARAGRQVIQRVAETVPCDTRMLVNWRTAGTWEAATGRRALTEGMAPWLRPAILQHVLPLLVGANEFFDNPQANRDFLVRERVQYLVVVEPGVWIGTHSGRVPTERDADAVATLPEVHPIVRDRWVSIFAVGSNEASADGGRPSHCF